MKSLQLDDPDKEGKRGKGTKYALIMAGLELFGEYGLKGTSTRMLADKSGANVSAIPYYFGGKEGLYRAVLEYIRDRVNEYIGLKHASIRQVLAEGTLSKKHARELLLELIDSGARMFVDSDEPQAWARIIMREQVAPTEAFDIIYKSQMRPMQDMVATLIAACLELEPTAEEVKIRSHALLGQVLSFTLCRESLLRFLGVKKLRAQHVQLIHQILAAHTESVLNSPLSGERK